MSLPLPFSVLDAYLWSDTPMWVFDLTRRRMAWANPAGVTFWNAASLEEFLARDFSNLSEATITRNEAVMMEHAAGRQVRMQWTVYPKGRPVTFNAHTNAVLLADGTEAILYEAHALPQIIDPSMLRGVEAMQHTSVLVGLHRFDGSAAMRNPAAVRTLGMIDPSTRDDDFGAMFVDLATAETARRKVMAGQVFSAEVELASRTGARWYGLDARPVSDPVTGEPLIQINARDIDELKATQEDLRRAKEVAEAASAAKGQFLANMSHEIRTPMNAILGLVYLLQSRPLGAAEQDMVQKIHNAGRSLLGIINDILDVSKIDAGRLEIEHAPFQLGDVLDNVAAIMSAAIGESHVELIVDPVPAGANFLKGDALRLGQILINLVGNAIKFTTAGEVVLTVSLVAARSAEVDLRFAVRDTGIGIAAEKQEAIFTAFAQADGSTTRRFGGSGLGLTITRHIVGLMGGSINLTSVPGKGSEFSFVIPVALDERGGLLPFPPGTRQRVLIADDHPIAQATLAELARSMGWTAILASSGADAMAQVLDAADAGTPFDALFLDWKMPGMDGLTAAARLRVSLGGRQPPAIIMVTGTDREHLLRDPLAGAADAVLAKPVTASAMYNAFVQARRKISGQQEESTGRRVDARLAGLCILVVDDSDSNRFVVRQVLENHGARVLLAADGSEALQKLRTMPHRVHIVLMDVQMPVMDGYEATRQIRETLHLADLPVVALTAGAFKNQHAEALEAGMNGFVSKPFEVDDLIAAVLRLTGRSTATLAPATSPAQNPSPIDLERGLSQWGDNATYRKYLVRFTATHGQDGQEIARLLIQGRRKDAASLLHKLKGAAGSMALMKVRQQAESMERALHQGKDAGANLQDLQAALEDSRSAIATYCGNEEAPRMAAPEAMQHETTVTSLLDELSQVLDRDNPDQAEPILERLSGKLLPDQLAALRGRLDAFDFRGAEFVVDALRARPNIVPQQVHPEGAAG